MDYDVWQLTFCGLLGLACIAGNIILIISVVNSWREHSDE